MILATIATDEYRELRDVTFANKQAYCQRHGHSFVPLTEVIHHARPVLWSKIKLLEMLAFQHQKGWVFWMDADAAIVRMDWNAEELTDGGADLVISRNAEGLLGTGSFLIQLTPISREFLLDVYDQIRFTHHRHADAAAMGDLLKRGYPLSVKYVEKYLIDGEPGVDFQEGNSAVVHLRNDVGEGIGERAEKLKRYL